MLKRLAYVVCLIGILSTNAFAVTDIWEDKLFIDGEVRTFAIFDKDIVNRKKPAGSTISYNEVPTRILLGAGYRITPDITIFARGGYFTLWGEEDGQTFATDGLTDKLNFVEGYAEFKNIFNSVDVKVGRQFYASDEVFYKPLGYSVERLVYAAIDGVSTVIRTDKSEIKLLGGKEADIVYGDLGDKYAYGFESKTNFNKNVGIQLYAYNIHTSGTGDYTLYGAKPYVNYKNASMFLRYIKNRDENHQHGQFFHIDTRYTHKAEAFTLMPKASVIWGTGQTHWNTITYLRSLIVEQALGGNAFIGAEIYSAGVDFSLSSLSKALFSLDGYYFNSRKHNVPDRGFELDLKATYQVSKNLELGVAGGYLFADKEFQHKDTQKLQLWFVFKV